MVISGIGSSLSMGVKIFTDTIQIKQLKRKYFAIKHEILYCYAYERAREAEKEIAIKETKAIEKD
jgi:Trk-type K+ transport system membrane component